MEATKSGAYAQKIVSFLVCMLFFVQIGCGTILYPERRGQKTPTLDRIERIDRAGVIPDGASLLIFFVPGVVAFGVDFATGDIYLLPGETNFLKSKSEAKRKDVQIVRIDPDKLNLDTVKSVVQEHTGYAIQFDAPNVHIFKPNGHNPDIQQELSKLGLEF
jgi:hypothetical protein